MVSTQFCCSVTYHFIQFQSIVKAKLFKLFFSYERGKKMELEILAKVGDVLDSTFSTSNKFQNSVFEVLNVTNFNIYAEAKTLIDTALDFLHEVLYNYSVIITYSTVSKHH